MRLESNVMFKYKTDEFYERHSVNGHMVGHAEAVGNIKNLNEFRDLVTKLTNSAKRGINKVTYKIDLNRIVTIRDTDDLLKYKSVAFPDEEMSVILSTTGKILRISDINTLFKKEFPKFFFIQHEYNCFCPIYLESFDGHDVLVHALDKDNIVIDPNLNQIWPVATNQPPIGLINMLSKTKEKVY